jgi:GR25 family glycosyltransferase involved in LPS biosynthesis
MWYVNLKDSKDRRQCMDKQIDEMGMKPHRFAAFSFKRCRAASEDDIVTCLAQKKYGDCVKSGVNWGAIGTHGSAGNTELDRMYKIVSNWCSHKRMMAYMLKKHNELNMTKKPKYAVILEDDVAFDRKEFLRKVVNFAETYDGKLNRTWSMVQIDPFGSKCDKHIVGYFEGLPVWKPKNVNQGWECSNYWGAQALLIKYDAIPSIIKHMEEHPTVPLDWLPAHLPGGLALRANIALNPEASRSVHMKVPMPTYCQKSVKASTIGGFRQKSLGRAMALAQKSGENPLDTAKVIVDPEDADYATLVEKYNSAATPATYSEWMDMQEKATADLKKYGIQ